MNGLIIKISFDEKMGNCNKSHKEEFLKAQNEKLESQLERAEAEIKVLKLERDQQVKIQMQELVKECLEQQLKVYRRVEDNAEIESEMEQIQVQNGL